MEKTITSKTDFNTKVAVLGKRTLNKCGQVKNRLLKNSKWDQKQ